MEIEKVLETKRNSINKSMCATAMLSHKFGFGGNGVFADGNNGRQCRFVGRNACGILKRGTDVGRMQLGEPLRKQWSQNRMNVMRAKRGLVVPAAENEEANIQKEIQIDTKERNSKILGIFPTRWNAYIGPIVMGVAMVLALVTPHAAEAARSGGRVGGRGFPGRGTSFSAYGSGTSSSRFGGSMGHSSGFGHHRSMGQTLPNSRPVSVRTNAFFFSPFGFGFGYGYPMGYGFGIPSLLFWAVFAIIAAQVVRGVLDRGDDDYELDSGERFSVAKVQVGLLASARDLQRDLERIASRADTSSSSGLHYVLQETVLSLLRNPNFAVYGYGRSGVERSVEDAEARFNKLSLEERGKFERETRINVSGRRNIGSVGKMDVTDALNRPVSELIVVTILVAVDGRLKISKVTDRESLIDALTTLGGIPASSVLAVEVLWTPEEEDDYYTVNDIIQDYPLLQTL